MIRKFKFPNERSFATHNTHNFGCLLDKKHSWETLALDAYLPHQVVPVVEVRLRVHLRVRRKEVEGDGGGVGGEARIAGDLVADLILMMPKAIEISPKRKWKKHFSPERKMRACR